MKKQEVLIEAFKRFYDSGHTKWKLLLIGSYLPIDNEFIDTLKKASKGYPIELLTNVSYNTLQEYYCKAKIYWHAAGYGENLQQYPERAEHFGISTIEAMATGTVPVVINAGGQREIVQDGENGFLWNTIDELITKTEILIKDDILWKKISAKAKKHAESFNQEKFCEEVKNIIL